MVTDKFLLNYKEVSDVVFKSIEQRKKLLVTYINQHAFNILFRNEQYSNLIKKNFTVYQADTGMYLTLKYFFSQKAERIDATELNNKILDKVIEKKISIAIIGGNFNEELLLSKCREKRINISGYAKGFFNTDMQSIIDKVSKFNCNVYFVGMGIPKQEIFAYELSKSLENKIIICVGNFFEFYFGTVKRAPVIIRKTGFEWLFRLFTEPERLWQRYVLRIPEFIYRMYNLKKGHKP